MLVSYRYRHIHTLFSSYAHNHYGVIYVNQVSPACGCQVCGCAESFPSWAGPWRPTPRPLS